MLQYILPAIRLTLISIVVFIVAYSTLIWSVAQAGPAKGKGETVTVNNKVVGYKLEGQLFTDDKYFNSRPSAVNYNAAGSGGSNKGTSNPDYLKNVQERLDSFLVHNPTIKKDNVPSELLTASGSGLDPDLSVDGANVQVARISKARQISETTIQSLIQQQLQSPLLGLLGPAKINVLQLNIALDQLK